MTKVVNSKLYPILEETGETARNISKYTITLSQYVESQMEAKNINKQKLVLDSNLSEKTVQRVRNEANYMPSLQTVTAICLGLKTSILESYLMVDLAGLRIRPHVYEEAIYMRVLLEGAAFCVEEVNECLKALNCKPLGT